jgi:cell division protein FtsL
MLKLLLCLICAFAIAVATLQLRQQQLELRHQAARLQEQIESQQARLWSQQLQISLQTATPTVARTISQQGLDLTPETKLPETIGNWVNRRAK